MNNGIFGLNPSVQPIRVAFIGKQCAGKTTLASMFCSQMESFNRVDIIKFADPIYEALRAIKKKKNRAFMQGFGTLAMRCFGEHIFVDLFEQRVLEIEDIGDSVCMVCDDVRRKFEFDCVRDNGFITVYIDAPDDVRMKRAKRQKIEFIENHESEIYIDELKGLCDMQFDGNVNLKDMEMYVDAIKIFANTR